MKSSKLFATVLLAAACTPAFAYVGPGAGLTLLGALWGLLAAVGAVLMFVIAWPLRRWRKRVKAARHRGDADVDADNVSAPHISGNASGGNATSGKAHAPLKSSTAGGDRPNAD